MTTNISAEQEENRRNRDAEALRDIAMADAGDTEARTRVLNNTRYNKFLDERSTSHPETRESALGEMLSASQGLALPLMIKKLDEMYGEDTARPVLNTREEQERYIWQRFSGKQREAVEQHRAMVASCERTKAKLTDYIAGMENLDAEDRANLPRLLDGQRLAKVERVHEFMRTYILPLDSQTDTADMLLGMDALEDELFDAIGTDEESAQLVAQALMGWAERVKASGRVTGGDEFTVAVGKKLHNWAHHLDVYGKEMGVMAMYNTPAREGHWMTSEDIERQLEAHRHTQAKRAESQQRQNARSILRTALNRAVEISDNTGFWEGAYRTTMQMAGDTSLYLIPGAGAYIGSADVLVGGMTESVDSNNTQWIFDENAERPSEQGASVQAMQDAMVQVGVELLPGGKVAGKGLSAIMRRVTGRALSQGTKPGVITRWLVNTTQKSTGRALLYEGAVSFVEEGVIEPIAQGIATMGSDGVLDMLGIDHGKSRSMKEAFAELGETWQDPQQVAALAMFTAALTGASYPGVRANVKWFQNNRNMWESLGLKPEVVDEVMASPDPMQRGQQEVEKGWKEDTEGMRLRMLEKARQMKRAGEVLVLTGQGSADPDLAPDSTLSKAFATVWQEYEREGLVPHVEAAEDGKYKITETQTDGTTMELVLNAEDADAYLQSALDKADAKRVAAAQARLGADKDAEIIDLRDEIATAASTIAGTAALRQVEQDSDKHGITVEDVTAGLPDEIATPIKNQGYVTLKDAENISEYAMGVIQGLTAEGMNEADARMSKNEAAGMARSWGYWAEFAENFAHREAMAGLAPGEGRSSISRTRGAHTVNIDGREVFGSSLMGVKGSVTHYGALEDVTESVFDMMVQNRAQAILESREAAKQAAGEEYTRTPQETQDAETKAWQELGDIAKRARAAIMKADKNAKIEEVVDGDRMSITEAFSTMALSKFITSNVLPTWMQSLGKALQANATAGDAINTVRKAYAAAMRKDAKAMKELDTVLEKLGVQVRDVFAEARIEQADIMAWKQARAATYAAMNGVHGVGGKMVTDAVQTTQEEYEAIERKEKKPPVTMENPVTPSQLERQVREGMDGAQKVTGSMAGVFEDDQGIYNPAGGYWMGLIDKTKLKDGIEQVKVGDKGKHGVIRGRELVGKFQASAAPLYVFKRKSGELTVMSGRHRFELMMRDTDCKAHPCYVFEESDVYDERWARMMDYENNMRDDQADELTAATYVRETGYDDSILKEKGLMRNESRSKTGAFIGRHASEELFVRFKNRALGKSASENAKNAYTICQLTYTIKDKKRIEDIQTRCAMLLEQGKSWEYIGAVSQLLANKERVVERQGLLDLGADFEADMERMAKFVEKNLQLLKESIDVIKQSKKLSKEKRAQAERLGITTATSAENEEMLADLNELKAQFEAIGSFPDLIARAQMWDGVTPLDPVGLYLQQKEEAQRRREEEGADEYLEGQVREIADDGTPDLFSAEMKGASQVGHIEKNVTFAMNKAKHNLLAVHSLSVENFMKSVEAGGIPLPSVAITRADKPYRWLRGNIYLVGTSDLINPAKGTDVYSADAWTGSYPELMHKRMNEADFDEVSRACTRMSDQYSRSYNSLEYRLQKAETPEEVRRLLNTDHGKGLYAYMAGYQPRAKMRYAPMQYDFVDKQLVKETRSMWQHDEIKEGQEQAFADAVEAAFKRWIADMSETYQQAYSELYKDMLDDLKTLGRPYGLWFKFKRCIEAYGKKEPDETANEKMLEAYADKHKRAHAAWVEEKVSKWLSPEVYIKANGKEANLHNLTNYMLRNKGLNKERHFVFGAGKVRAGLAAKLDSLRAIKARRDHLTDSETSKASKEKSNDLMAEFRSEVSKYAVGGIQGKMSASEYAMEALAKVRGTPTKEKLAAILRRDFDYMQHVDELVHDDKVLELGVETIEAIRAELEDYFEAVPRRAVTMDEWKYAVMPETLKKNKALMKAIKQNGIKPIWHDGSPEGAKAAIGTLEGDESVSFAMNSAALKRMDAEYMAAVQRGDMTTAARMVREYAALRGYTTDDEWRMMHRAPGREGYDTPQERLEAGAGISVVDMADGYTYLPSDYWDAAWLYGNNYDVAHSEAFSKMSRALREAEEWRAGKRRREPSVWMYRAVPKDVKGDYFQNGDWLTPSMTYAKMHGQSNINGAYRIVKNPVPVSCVFFNGDDICEWGYDDGHENAYANTKNNVKRMDAVVRERDGRIIPLSKRFNKREFFTTYLVIGKNALTWKEHAKRAFRGRDDNMARAELDDTNMRLKYEWKTLRIVEPEKQLAERLEAFVATITEEELKEMESIKVLSRRKHMSKLSPVYTLNAEEERLYNEVVAKHRAADGLLTRAEKALGVHLPDHSYAAILKPQDAGYEGLATAILNLEENKTMRAGAAQQYIGKLGDILDYPELFAAYPVFKNLRVERHRTWEYGGYYDQESNVIALNDGLDEQQVLDVLVHEIQHAIQAIEGFARGGSPESAREEVRAKQYEAMKNLETGRDVYNFLNARERALEVAQQMRELRSMSREEFLSLPVNGELTDRTWGSYVEMMQTGNPNATREELVNALWVKAMRQQVLRLERLTEQRNGYDGYLLFNMPTPPRVEDCIMGETDIIDQYIAQLNEVPDAYMLVDAGVLENPDIALLQGLFDKWAYMGTLNDNELYRRLAGEQESRNVELRREATMEERKRIPFNLTLEYKPNESIVTYNVIGPKAATWQKYAQKAYTGRDDGMMRAEIDSSKARLVLGATEQRVKQEAELVLWKIDQYIKALNDEKRELLMSYLEAFRKDDRSVDGIKREQELEQATSGMFDDLYAELGGIIEKDWMIFLMPGSTNREREAVYQVREALQQTPEALDEMKLSDALEYPELYEAYPQLAYYRVRFLPMQRGMHGFLDPRNKTIALNVENSQGTWERTLLHEIQHAIQEIEGFAKGGSDTSVNEQVQASIDATEQEISMLENELRWFAAVDIARDYLKEARKIRKYPNAWKNSGLRFRHSKLAHDSHAIREEILRDIAALYEQFRANDTQNTAAMGLEDYTLPKVMFSDLDGIERGLAALDKLKSRKLAFRGAAAAKNRRKGEVQKRNEVLKRIMSQYGQRPYEMYRRLAGEVEARNVQHRQSMTATQREMLPFNETLEYKDESIVTFNTIGKNAKTWADYTDRVFAGRDDGMPRAEIDASQAKLKDWNQKKDNTLNVRLFREVRDTFLEQNPLYDIHKQGLNVLEQHDHSIENIRKAGGGDMWLVDELLGLYTALKKRLSRQGISFDWHLYNAVNSGLFKAMLHPTDENIEEFLQWCENKFFTANTLGDVMDYPELYAAYPHLRDIELRWFRGAPDYSGAYTCMPKDKPYYIVINSNRTEEQTLNTLLHEIQHLIQEYEGFAMGGTSSLAKLVLEHKGQNELLAQHEPVELYKRLSGEIEARAVAKRRTLTADLREADPFNDFMEYPGKGIVVYRGELMKALDYAASNRSFQMEKATLAGLHLLQNRVDEQQGEMLIKEWKRLAEQWSTMGGDEGQRLGSGAKFLGELNALLSATRNVLPEKYARMGRFNGLMRWATVYAQMMQDGKVPRHSMLKGAIYQKFVEAMTRRDEHNRLNGMTDAEAKEAIAVIAGERLDAAMDKVVVETIYRLEMFLKDRERERIDWIVKRAYPKREEGQKWPRGKMDADSYRRMEDAYKLMGMEANDVAKLIEGVKHDLEELDPEEDGYAEREAELEDKLFLAHTFGCWENMGVEQARRACGSMVELVMSGRTSWKKKLDKERRKADYTRMVMANHFTTSLSEMQQTRQQNDRNEKSDNLTKVKKFGMGFMSYSQLMVALRKSLGAEFADRQLRLIAEAHENTLCFQNELHTWLYDTLQEITGLDNEKDIAAWVNSNNQTEHTGIYLNIPVKETISITAEDAKVWLALTPEQRQERRDRLMEEGRKKQEKPIIPGEDIIPRLEDMVKQSKAKGRTPEAYSLVTEYSYKSEIVATKEAMMYAILTFEQPDYVHLMHANGLSLTNLQHLRDYVGRDMLRWGYAMRKKLSEHGKLLAEVYEEYNGVPFAQRDNYFRGMFDISTLKDKGENPGQGDGNGGIGCGKYGILTPRQYHNQKINWTTSATSVFIGTMKEQNNYICTSHITREWKVLLSHPLFEKRLRAEIGDAALTLITGWTKMLDGAALADMRVNAMMNRLFGKLLSAYAVSRLAGNVYTIVKQISALLHGLVGGLVPTKVIEDGEVCKMLTYHRVGFGDYLKALSKAMVGKTEITVEEMQQAAYIKGRKNVRGRKIEAATMLNPDEKVPGAIGRKAELVSETAMDAIHFVDVKSNTRAALALAEVVYQRAKKENADGLVPDEELRRVAIQTAGLMIDRVAQPRLRTQQNFWTAGGGWAGCLGNFLTMFKSETLAKLGEYIALAMNGQYFHLGAAAFSYGLLNALILALIDWVRGYGDDDEDATQWWLTLGTNVVFNDLGSVPVFGTGVEWVKHKIAGGYMPQSSPMEMVVPYSELWKYSKQVYRNFDKDASWDKHLNSLTGLLRTLGGASGWAQNSTIGPMATVSSLTLAAATMGNLTRFGRDIYKKTVDEDEPERKPQRGKKQLQIVE